MATTNPSVCEAFSCTHPYWKRFEDNVTYLNGTQAFAIACHAFGKTDEEILDGKAIRGFMFGVANVGFPQSVLVRGDAASCHIVIEAEETGKLYCVGVRQQRVPIGCKSFLEDVAGMLDIYTEKNEQLETINIVPKIVKEIKEELGVDIHPSKLINLSQWQQLHAKSFDGFLPEDVKIKGMVPSAGGCDEQIVIFGCIIRAPLKYIQSLQGKQAGNASEHERTTICIYPEEDAIFLFKDSKFFTGHVLLKEYERFQIRKSNSSSTFMSDF
jgi:hypothetical protein